MAKEAVYANSRYARGHTDLTKTGLLIELGESYLMSDLTVRQVMSVEALGDCNIIIRHSRTGELKAIHAGIDTELFFVCSSKALYDVVDPLLEEEKAKILLAAKKKIIDEYGSAL